MLKEAEGSGPFCPGQDARRHPREHLLFWNLTVKGRGQEDRWRWTGGSHLFRIWEAPLQAVLLPTAARIGGMWGSPSAMLVSIFTMQISCPMVPPGQLCPVLPILVCTSVFPWGVT